MKTKILWDLWMIQWLVEMSEPKLFKHYGYFPIDGEPFHPSWTNLIKTMDAVITYSKYGQQLVENAMPSVNVDMIYHGVDTDTFQPRICAHLELGKRHQTVGSVIIKGILTRFLRYTIS